jgi:hypothetical protein
MPEGLIALNLRYISLKTLRCIIVELFWEKNILDAQVLTGSTNS